MEINQNNTALQCTTLRCSAVHCTLQCTALYIVLPATAHCTAHCTEHCTGAHYHTDVCTVHSAVRESAGVSVRAAPHYAASCKYRGHYSTPPPPCMGEVRTYSIHPHQPSYNLGFPPNGAVGPTGRICLPIPSSHSVILQLVTHLVRGMLRCSGVKVVNV